VEAVGVPGAVGCERQAKRRRRHSNYFCKIDINDYAFGALTVLTVLVGRQEEHPACKN